MGWLGMRVLSTRWGWIGLRAPDPGREEPVTGGISAFLHTGGFRRTFRPIQGAPFFRSANKLGGVRDHEFT